MGWVPQIGLRGWQAGFGSEKASFVVTRNSRQGKPVAWASDQVREGRRPEFQIAKNRGTPGCFVQTVRKLLNLREMIFALVKESEKSPSEIGVKIPVQLAWLPQADSRQAGGCPGRR